MTTQSTPFLIIDGHSLAYRSYYGFPSSLTFEGKPINAVYGFVALLFKAIDDFKPGYLCVCFDRKEPTFRHDLYKPYKAHRPPAPEDFIDQVNRLKILLTALSIPMLEQPGYEADDLMGTLSLEAKKYQLHTLLMTGDQDALQLVDDSTSVIMSTKTSAPWIQFTPEEVFKKYQFTPIQMIEYKALRGDPSDGIPEVPGIGDKTAQALLTQFSTLENLYAHLDEVASNSVRTKLEINKELAFLSHHLATIHRESPLPLPIEALTFNPNWNAIVQAFSELNFQSLVNKYKKRISPADTAGAPVKSPNVDFQVGLARRSFSEGGMSVTSIDALNSQLPNLDKGFSFQFTLSSNQPMEAICQKLTIAPLAHDPFELSLETETPSTDSGPLFIDNALPDKTTTFLTPLKPYFENPKILKQVSNAKESEVFLKRYGIGLAGVDFDPMIASYLLGSPSDNSLSQLEEKGMKSLYEDIEMPLEHVLAMMEFEGVTLDIAYLHQLNREFSEEIVKIKAKVFELAGVTFNLNSPKQLGDVLFDTMGLPTIKKTKTGRSTDASVLEKLTEHHEIAKWILQHRSLEKLMSTYVVSLPKLINPRTGKIHTSFNQVGTTTGRLSSINPNLQNIPIRSEEGAKIRRAFIPSTPNRLILSADYSQIELRVLAHLSQDNNMLQAFKNGEDIHQTTASIIYNVPLTEVTKTQRYSAKAVNFGIIYGQSSFGLSENLGISFKEAKEIIDDYFAKFPQIQAFIDSTIKSAQEKGLVTTEFGRIRPIPDILSSNKNLRQFAERTAVNTRIQGTAADIMKLAMIAIQKEFEATQKKSKLIIQVHDELVIDLEPSEKEAVVTLLKTQMESVVSWEIPLSIDVEMGKNWAKMV